MENITTSTKRFAVLNKNFTYDYYGKHTIEAGARFKIGGRGGYRLAQVGLVMTLGHGVQEIIPGDCFHIETEVTETTKVTTIR